ncbi:hypothetical protein NT2_01_03630 [Caenibius tardaugens NBRC 16725]|uniref:EthD domain-containing protein n=1 Tax=Caenibius tardaugens NBRC 16725 TaxID=1219035 RepID=U2ZYJ0_9SPHN|nr:hypothetical protein [Caenibius tardaugens]AZI37165.1 hypothetical protein EGO55_15335 [Caenibius tardaugens NBRC 16725]GAD47593.1 hypothetical protein NT2_01_03630 [Caenibius tardaugens NBRC 16725]
MEKLCFVFHSAEALTASLLPQAEDFAREVMPLAHAVTLHIADTSPSGAPETLGQGGKSQADNLFDPTLYALASIWIDNLDNLAPLQRRASAMPGRHGIHLVTESAVLEYDRLSWTAGMPSPGKTLVALFRRHPALSSRQFRHRWAAHSELSRSIHPLSRYHRNHVVRTLAGDETWHGIVEERVADACDLAPERFYIGKGSRELAARDISEFIDVANGMKCNVMTEIIFKPPAWLAQGLPDAALCR